MQGVGAVLCRGWKNVFGLAVGAVWCYPYSVGANPFLTGAIV